MNNYSYISEMKKIISSIFILGIKKYLKHCRFRKNWALIKPGMNLDEVESIMGFKFKLDSENKKGRMVYSNHENDHLPFYLVVNRDSGKVIRKHEIKALEELY